MDPAFTLFRSIATASVALIVLVVVGWFAVVHIRRWMRDGSEGGAAFTLEDLRRMRREGELTEEEFETARAAMIGAVRRDPPPSIAEIKRRVRAGAEAAANRTVPPTSPGTPTMPGTSTMPGAPTPPSTSTSPSAPGASSAPIRITPDSGTQPHKSPKRPPQLG